MELWSERSKHNVLSLPETVVQRARGQGVLKGHSAARQWAAANAAIWM